MCLKKHLVLINWLLQMENTPVCGMLLQWLITHMLLHLIFGLRLSSFDLQMMSLEFNVLNRRGFYYHVSVPHHCNCGLWQGLLPVLSLAN